MFIITWIIFLQFVFAKTLDDFLHNNNSDFARDFTEARHVSFFIIMQGLVNLFYNHTMK